MARIKFINSRPTAVPAKLCAPPQLPAAAPARFSVAYINPALAPAVIVAVTLFTGCATAFASDDDPQLIRAAASFSLKMIERIHSATPDRMHPPARPEQHRHPTTPSTRIP